MSSSQIAPSGTSYVLYPPLCPLGDEDGEADTRLQKYRAVQWKELLRLLDSIEKKAENMYTQLLIASDGVPIEAKQDMQHLYVDACKAIIAMSSNHTWLDPTKVSFGVGHASNENHQATVLRDLKNKFELHHSFFGLTLSWEELMQCPELGDWQKGAWKLELKNWAKSRLGLDVHEVDTIQLYEKDGEDPLTVASAKCKVTLSSDGTEVRENLELIDPTEGHLTLGNTPTDWTCIFRGKNGMLDSDSFLHGTILDLDTSQMTLVDDFSIVSASTEALGKGKGKEPV